LRTTITLDDELLEELRKLAQRERVPFKRVVERVLRLGLRQAGATPRRRRYRTPTESMGLPSAGRLDKSLALAGALEDEEIARELAVGK
jgi:hypothetical protein